MHQNTSSAASEKRRSSPPALSGSPSRKARAPSGMLGSPSRAHHGRGSVIAHPPRAALSRSGTSSPAPDERERERERRSRANSASSGPGPTSHPSKDVQGTGTGSVAHNHSTTSSGSTPASTAVTQHLLKEKDARIAHLKLEMDLMENEFQRELDKLSMTESETAAFWQSKHSVLNQQYLRTDTELRLLRAEVEVRDAERHELKDGWEALKRQLRDKDDEIRALRGQVRGLKEWVSTSTRSDVDMQASDEVFGERMALLGNSLQNWVLANLRKAKLDLSQVQESTLSELNRLVPMYEELARTSKAHLIQSLVSQVLVESIFESYFVGLDESEARRLAQAETLLAHYAESPGPINQWRSTTLNIIKRTAPERLANGAASTTDAVVAKVNKMLEDMTGQETTEARDQSLRGLIASAIDLARLLAVQKAVFKVTMPEILPHQKIMFDGATMEDMGGEDEENLVEREICCVTFPGLIKRGDESGDHLHFRNIIAKSRVLCSPE